MCVPQIAMMTSLVCLRFVSILAQSVAILLNYEQISPNKQKHNTYTHP